MNSELVEKRLNTKYNELKNYEKKFNLIKNTNDFQQKNDYVFDPNINYLNNEHIVDFGLNKNKNLKKNVNEMLTLELSNFNYSKFSPKNDFKSLSLYLLNKYNHTIKDITEDNWVLYTKNKVQNKYELKDNEFIIDNSILIKNKSQKQLIYFLKNLYIILKNLGKQYEYNVHTKFYDDDYHQVCWLIFIFSKN